MRKFLLLSLAFMSGSFADEQIQMTPSDACCEMTTCRDYMGTKFEVGVSYYYFQSSVLRDIYDNGAANYRASISQNIWNNLDLWAGASYLHKNGKSLNAHERTSIQIVPVSLGLKYILPLNLSCVDLYLNGAFKYFFFKTHDHSDFVKEHRHKSGLGGVFGAGSYFNVSKHFFLDLFVDYSFKHMHFSNAQPNITGHSLQIGGWDFGGGLGYQF